jgi:hypothetical protein
MRGNFYLRRQDISSGRWNHLREGVSIDDILDSIHNDSQSWTEMDYHIGYGNWDDVLIVSTDGGEILNVDCVSSNMSFMKDLGNNEISNFLMSHEIIENLDKTTIFRNRLENLTDSRWSSQYSYEDDTRYLGALSRDVGLDIRQVDLLMLKETPRIEIMEMKDNSYRLMMDTIYEELMMNDDQTYFKFSKSKRQEMKDVYGFDFTFFYMDFDDPKEAKRYAEILYQRFLITEDKSFYPVDIDSVVEDSLNRSYFVPDLHWENDDDDSENETYDVGIIFPCFSSLLRDDEGNHYGAVLTPDDDKIFVGFVFLQINGDLPIYPDDDTKQLLEKLNLTKTGRWIIKEKKFFENFDETPYPHLQKRFSSRFDALHWVENTVKEQLEYRGPNSMKAALQKIGFELGDDFSEGRLIHQ